MKKNLVILMIVLVAVGWWSYNQKPQEGPTGVTEAGVEENKKLDQVHPLSIESLRNGKYEGSEIVVEEKLTDGSNYERFLTSYKSEGLKIFALLTIPKGKAPEKGWPAIVFNHGYIPPAQYRTTEKYIAYTDGFSRNGYVLFRPDYRGHGSSEGEAEGGYGSNAYTIDVINALKSLEKHEAVDEENIGMWGHSMGGFITLRNMVVEKEIKAGVIWAGVVASYTDLITNWRRPSNGAPTPTISPAARRWRQSLIDVYGQPDETNEFWKALSANSYLKEISGPVQIHHGTADTSVPVEFSRKLEDQLNSAGKEVEYYEYPGDDHNLSKNFSSAMRRSVEFFDKYLKPEKVD